MGALGLASVRAKRPVVLEAGNGCWGVPVLFCCEAWEGGLDIFGVARTAGAWADDGKGGNIGMLGYRMVACMSRETRCCGESELK